MAKLTNENRRKLEVAIIETILEKDNTRELIYDAIVFGRVGLRQMNLNDLRDVAELWGVSVKEALS